jgi:hypothetical protein
LRVVTLDELTASTPSVPILFCLWARNVLHAPVPPCRLTGTVGTSAIDGGPLRRFHATSQDSAGLGAWCGKLGKAMKLA